MNEIYFLIEEYDENISVVSFTKKKGLLEFINHSDVEYDASKALKTLNFDNPKMWKGHHLLIKGEIIVPKPKEIVLEWDI